MLANKLHIVNSGLHLCNLLGERWGKWLPGGCRAVLPLRVARSWASEIDKAIQSIGVTVDLYVQNVGLQIANRPFAVGAAVGLGLGGS